MGYLKRVEEKELHSFFEGNLKDLIRDDKLKSYVVDLMIDFAHNNRIPFLYDGHLGVMGFDSGESQNRIKMYNYFKETGDIYLFLCGFFPEYLVKRKKSGLGLKSSMESGRISYRYAVSLGAKIRDEELAIETLSRVSKNFKEITKAIFDFRNKIDGGRLLRLNPETIREIKEVMYDGESIIDKFRVPLLNLH